MSESGRDLPALTELARLLDLPWLLVGVGNELRADDAFGPFLARRLAGMGLPALDGGLALENLTGPILRAAPEELILADAADFGGEPGALRLLDPTEIAEGGVSTHDAGFGGFIAYLTANRRLSIRLLTMQLASVRLGDPPGPHVYCALDLLADLFRKSASSRQSAP